MVLEVIKVQPEYCNYANKTHEPIIAQEIHGWIQVSTKQFWAALI